MAFKRDDGGGLDLLSFALGLANGGGGGEAEPGAYLEDGYLVIPDEWVEEIDAEGYMVVKAQYAEIVSEYLELKADEPKIQVIPLSATQNSTYIAPHGKAYSPVNVNVPQTTVEPLNILVNGTYTAPEGKAYSPVTVDTGYSIHDFIVSGLPVVFIDYAPTKPNGVAFQLTLNDLYTNVSKCRAIITPNAKVVTSIKAAPMLELVVEGSRIAFQNFSSCQNLKTLVMLGAYSLENANAFTGTKISEGTGYVYVPDELVSNYKSATIWVAYETQIKGYSEADNYNIATTYSIGDVCVYNGKFYAYINETDAAGHTPTGETDENWFLIANLEV